MLSDIFSLQFYFNCCFWATFGENLDAFNSDIWSHRKAFNVYLNLPEKICQTELTWFSPHIRVTRFGEIPPLLHKIKSLGHLLNGSFSIEHHFYHTLVDFQCFWAKFYCYLCLNIEQIIFQSGHTGSYRSCSRTSAQIL